MVDETDNPIGDDAAGSTTPVDPGDPAPPFDRTMKLDRAIAERDLRVPSHFGRYEVSSRIGIGGFASVYAARDPELDAPVAIKVLAENHSADVEVRKRFVAEARVARRLGGDRLIGVFDLGETDDGRPFVVMELAGGGTLRARLSRLGRPTRDCLLRLIDELGACMAAIHDQDVVHRDIKPSNLLLRSTTPMSEKPTQLIGDDERLVLADFGLARDISAGASAVTVGGGTAGYMAPEQADPKGKADFRADIYAATVVVAELTTGRHPERLDLGTAKLAPAVRNALEDGLSIDREQRPDSASQWTDRLLTAYRDEAPTKLITVDGADPAPDATRMQAPYPYGGGGDYDESALDEPGDDGAEAYARSSSTTNAGDDESLGTSVGTAAAEPNAGAADATQVLPENDGAQHDRTDVVDHSEGTGRSRTELYDTSLSPESVDSGEPPPPPPSVPLNPRLQRPAPGAEPPARAGQHDGRAAAAGGPLLGRGAGPDGRGGPGAQEWVPQGRDGEEWAARSDHEWAPQAGDGQRWPAHSDQGWVPRGRDGEEWAGAGTREAGRHHEDPGAGYAPGGPGVDPQRRAPSPEGQGPYAPQGHEAAPGQMPAGQPIWSAQAAQAPAVRDVGVGYVPADQPPPPLVGPDHRQPSGGFHPHPQGQPPPPSRGPEPQPGPGPQPAGPQLRQQGPPAQGPGPQPGGPQLRQQGPPAQGPGPQPGGPQRAQPPGPRGRQPGAGHGGQPPQRPGPQLQGPGRSRGAAPNGPGSGAQRASVTLPDPAGPPARPPERSGVALEELPRKERRQQEKLIRKTERKRRRRRRRRRFSNLIRGLMRGLIAAMLTLIAGLVFASASTGVDIDRLQQDAPDAVGAVNLAMILAFFLGIALFPWPRRLDPDG